jgi:hypothetical protein
MTEICIYCFCKSEEIDNVSTIPSIYNIKNSEKPADSFEPVYPVRVKSQPIKLPSNEEEPEVKQVDKPVIPIQPSVFQHSVLPPIHNVQQLIEASNVTT